MKRVCWWQNLDSNHKASMCQYSKVSALSIPDEEVKKEGFALDVWLLIIVDVEDWNKFDLGRE